MEGVTDDAAARVPEEVATDALDAAAGVLGGEDGATGGAAGVFGGDAGGAVARVLGRGGDGAATDGLGGVVGADGGQLGVDGVVGGGAGAVGGDMGAGQAVGEATSAVDEAWDRPDAGAVVGDDGAAAQDAVAQVGDDAGRLEGVPQAVSEVAGAAAGEAQQGGAEVAGVVSQPADGGAQRTGDGAEEAAGDGVGLAVGEAGQVAPDGLAGGDVLGPANGYVAGAGAAGGTHDGEGASATARADSVDLEWFAWIPFGQTRRPGRRDGSSEPETAGVQTAALSTDRTSIQVQILPALEQVVTAIGAMLPSTGGPGALALAAGLVGLGGAGFWLRRAGVRRQRR